MPFAFIFANLKKFTTFPTNLYTNFPKSIHPNKYTNTYPNAISVYFRPKVSKPSIFQIPLHRLMQAIPFIFSSCLIAPMICRRCFGASPVWFDAVKYVDSLKKVHQNKRWAHVLFSVVAMLFWLLEAIHLFGLGD